MKIIQCESVTGLCKRTGINSNVLYRALAKTAVKPSRLIYAGKYLVGIISNPQFDQVLTTGFRKHRHLRCLTSSGRV